MERRSLGRVRFWVDDLGEITRVVRQAVEPAKATITVDDDYKADEVTDLANYPSTRMKSFAISAPDAGVELLLSNRRAELTLRNPSMTVLGMATKVEEVANRRKLRTTRRLAVWISAAFLPFCLYLGTSDYLSGPGQFWVTREDGTKVVVGDPTPLNGVSQILYSTPIATLIIVVCGTLSILLLWHGAKSLFVPDGAILLARTEKDAPPWLRRNMDALVTNAIVSAVFLVLGILIGYVLPKA